MVQRTHLARFETKSIDDESRTFEGYVSTWDMDLGGDIIRPGAFKRTIDHWKAGKKIVPLLDSHSGFQTIRSAVGKRIDAREDENGLWGKWQVIPGADGDEVMHRLHGGVIDGMSIGYRPIKFGELSEEEKSAGAVRALTEIESLEDSLVIWPMNDQARLNLDSVKAMLRGIDPDAEEFDPDRLAELRSIRDHINRALAKSEPAPEVYQGTEELATRLNHLFADRLARRIGTRA